MKVMTKGKKGGLREKGRSLPAQPARDEPVKRFIESVDYPRLEYLLGSDPRFTYLLQLMQEQKGVKRSFAAMLRRSGISLAEIQQRYIDGSKQLGMLELANRFPAIAADIGDDARTRFESCPSCLGEGFLKQVEGLEQLSDAALDNPQCPACKGEGTVRVMGDRHARDMVSNLLGLGSKQGGVTINNLLAQNSNFGGGGERVEDLLSKTAKLIDVKATEVKGEDDGAPV